MNKCIISFIFGIVLTILTITLVNIITTPEFFYAGKAEYKKYLIEDKKFQIDFHKQEILKLQKQIEQLSN